MDDVMNMSIALIVKIQEFLSSEAGYGFCKVESVLNVSLSSAWVLVYDSADNQKYKMELDFISGSVGVIEEL